MKEENFSKDTNIIYSTSNNVIDTSKLVITSNNTPLSEYTKFYELEYKPVLNCLHQSWDEKYKKALEFFCDDQNSPIDGDQFFKDYGVGNTANGEPSLPYERFKQYEKLLQALKDKGNTKYENLHKGLAYHYLAWLSYQMENYDTCLFYFDNALSEDRKNFPNDWKNMPAAQFLRLDESISDNLVTKKSSKKRESL